MVRSGKEVDATSVPAMLNAARTPIGWVQLIARILLSGTATAAIWILLPKKDSSQSQSHDIAPDKSVDPAPKT
jgi:hypothetical protein